MRKGETKGNEKAYRDPWVKSRVPLRAKKLFCAFSQATDGTSFFNGALSDDWKGRGVLSVAGGHVKRQRSLGPFCSASFISSSCFFYLLSRSIFGYRDYPTSQERHFIIKT